MIPPVIDECIICFSQKCSSSNSSVYTDTLSIKWGFLVSTVLVLRQLVIPISLTESIYSITHFIGNQPMSRWRIIKIKSFWMIRHKKLLEIVNFISWSIITARQTWDQNLARLKIQARHTDITVKKHGETMVKKPLFKNTNLSPKKNETFFHLR